MEIRLDADADAAARAEMTRYLLGEKVDQKTINAVRDSPGKSFLMSMIPPGQPHAGICLASRPWLTFCGLSENDVAWKDPKTLLQGPLTSQMHISQMRQFFSVSHKPETQAHDNEMQHQLVIRNLVNYRAVQLRLPLRAIVQTFRKPFKFTLHVGRLMSVVTGKPFSVFHAHLTNEKDLLEDIDSVMAEVDDASQMKQIAPMHYPVSTNQGFCMKCNGESIQEIQDELLTCMADFGIRCNVQASDTIDASLHVDHEALTFVVRLFHQMQDGTKTPAAMLTHSSGSFVDFMELCEKLNLRYQSRSEKRQGSSSSSSSVSDDEQLELAAVRCCTEFWSREGEEGSRQSENDYNSVSSSILDFELWEFDGDGILEADGQAGEAFEGKITASADKERKMMEIYAQAVCSHDRTQSDPSSSGGNSGRDRSSTLSLHPAMRREMAYALTRLCTVCPSQPDASQAAWQRQLLMEVTGGAGGTDGPLHSMLGDPDTEIERCGLAILRELFRDKRVAEQDKMHLRLLLPRVLAIHERAHADHKVQTRREMKEEREEIVAELLSEMRKST